MALLYKVPDKKRLEIRNSIFVDSGIPALKQNGFTKSPFSGAWFGRNNLGDYTYELCRLADNLEIITTHISRRDKWIKIYLNIFSVNPKLNSINELHVFDGLQYKLPPNSITRMRLRSDEQKGPPILHMLFGKQHKLGVYVSESGLKKRIEELRVLIEDDMTHINYFVRKWYQIHHTPVMTGWDGRQLKV
jgi:hypothetical protein